ncbi:xylulokinase [Microtetraspora sp. NBRC 13810]|uniref:xylulokinase n=1 Tax=Microtetraspora sp. NBRC 13810 TaxID=3030990 RepID=UPI0024A1CC7C|nr:xylulokinase [Microtetraspora sp. NBRC 13810]GLW09998.1 xylulokinase [Microtetraspora sp. NBRC 13810]
MSGNGARLVAGVDSSTQSCKVVIREAETGALVREGRAAHPEGTEVHPDAWWAALNEAIDRAGGLDDVAAVSVAAQQHGMVCLDEDGEVVRPALLWNDTRSAAAARDLVAELGGPEKWAEAVGSVPVASFTVTKLRWLAEHEPEHARRTRAVCLPHDWLTWKLAGAPGLRGLTTDRGDASGTGYWSPATGAYRTDLLETALGSLPELPRVLSGAEQAGVLRPAVAGSGGRVAAGSGAGGERVLAAGTGDNMAAALGVGARPGDVVVSIGTSGTAFAVADTPSADPSGHVAGFADATGRFLPLVATLNAARVLDAAARMLGVSLDRLGELAREAPAGAGGLVLVPYLEGERTPNLPDATGSLYGLTLATATPAHLARAAIEGLLCHLADALDALGLTPERVLLIGGGARSEALREIAPEVFGRPVVVPRPGEYVADGAARQAAWLLAGTPEPPPWTAAGTLRYDGAPAPAVRARYAEARAQTHPIP